MGQTMWQFRRGVSLDISARRWERPPYCPNCPVVEVEGELRQYVTCRRLDCPYCVHGHIAQVRESIRASAPAQMLTLDCLPTDAYVARQMVHSLLKALKRQHRVEYVPVLERHRSGELHAHVLLHSTLLSTADPQPYAARLGFLHVRLDPYGDRRGEYLLKEARFDQTRAQHLADNAGGLTLRSSRNFYRDLATGEVFSGVTTARAEQRRRWCIAHGYGSAAFDPNTTQGRPETVEVAARPIKG